MRSYEQEVKDLTKLGIKVEGTSFGDDRVRNVDNDPMDVNDVFEIPAKYEVLSTMLGDRKVQFLLLPIKNEKTGVERYFRFFPNQLAKFIFAKNNDQTMKVKTEGTAAKAYQEFATKDGATIDSALAALAGKPIKITAKQAYTVNKFGSTTETTSTNIYTYDFVEGKK
jgi:hypothetical protein